MKKKTLLQHLLLSSPINLSIAHTITKKCVFFAISILLVNIGFSQITVTYTQQQANYPANWSNSAGPFNQGSYQLGEYANGAGSSSQTVSWRKFTTLGTTSDLTSNLRSLQIGDSVVITLSASRAYGEIGFSLLSSPSSEASWSDRQNNAAISVILDGPDNTSGWGAWYVKGASSTAFPILIYGDQGTFSNYTFSLVLTAKDRMNVYINKAGTTSVLYDVSLGNSNPITDYCVYLQDDWDNAEHENVYWGLGASTTQHTVTNFNKLYLGNSGSSFTESNSITNGFAANSTSSAATNSLYKTGAGTLTLTGTTTYTGTTTVSAGTLSLQNNAAYTGTITPSSQTVAFSTAPTLGTYQILPAALSITTQSFTATGLGSGQTATLNYTNSSVAVSNTITFNGNSSTGGSTANQSIQIGTAANLTTNGYTRTGYTFNGWNTASDGSGSAYTDGASYTMGSTSVTLYAQWTINSYILTYSGNTNDGGTAPSSVTQNYNTTVSVSTAGTLTKTGYLFNGWNTASDGSGTVYAAGSTFTFTASTTLYAQWVVNPADADYRSDADGNLSVASTWQYYDGTTWQAASTPPTSTNSVSILNNVTFDQNFTVGSGKNLTINAGSLTIAAGNILTATGTIITNGYPMRLKSDDHGTASIGNSIGTITGNVIVERNIPANSERAWRILSVPTQTTQTIAESWQQNTQITSNRTDWATQGFDGPQQPFSSMLTYDPAHNVWDSVTSTNNSIATTSGYSIYIRGSRAESPSSSAGPTDSTTLFTTGPLYQGTQSAIDVPSHEFALIGNIYPSAVDFTALTTSNIDNTFYVWDPKVLNNPPSLGGYQTFIYAGGNWTVTPGGGSFGSSTAPTIESGEAFFVHNANGSAGSLQFTEAAKTSSAVNNAFRPASPSNTIGQLKTILSIGSGSSAILADANLEVFGSQYSDAVDGNDALKLANTQENFAINRNGSILVVEQQQPVTATDTIHFDMWNMKQQQYQLNFVATNLDLAGLTAYLNDNYLGTSTPINLTSGDTATTTFTIDANAASSASNRFSIVFNNNTPVPVIFTGIQASQVNTGIAVTWQVAGESGIKQYVVEHSTDGSNFTAAGTVAASSATSSYSWTDATPASGNNFYRVESVGVSGAVSYSSIVKVVMGNVQPGIAVYPNPVTGGNVNLQLTNQAAGNYTVRLLSINGQELYSNTISHSGGTGVQTLTLPSSVAAGIYKLEVITPDHNIYTQKLILE